MDDSKFENRESDLTNTVHGKSESGAPTQPYSQGDYPQPPEWTKNIVVSQKPWIPSGEEGNVSVHFNESEKSTQASEEDETGLYDELSEKKEWPVWLQIGIIILIALCAVLLTVHVIKLRNPAEEVIPSIQAPSDTSPVWGTIAPTTVPPYTEAPDKGTEENTAYSEESTTAVVSTEQPTSVSSVGNEYKDKDIKQIVEYFNESSNRVKIEATKVVQNFENRTHNEDKLNLPSVIKGVAKSILESKITDITEPVEYPSREAIIARYPVPGAEWSSKLTADDVAEAVCTENGDVYEITLFLRDCADPEPEKGPSRAMDCLDVPRVRDTAPPFITAFSAEYYDCVIRCRVEKSTGRVLWSNYTSSVLLRLGLDAGFVEFDADIGLTFEKDYSITY